MNTIIRRLCALAVSAMLMLGTALAGSTGLDWAAGGYLNGHEELRLHATATITSLLPYGDDTLAMMNALLENMSVGAKIANSGSHTEISFSVAGNSLVTLCEAQTEDGFALTTSLLPNRTLQSRTSPISALSGLEEEEPMFDLFTAIEEAEACYQALTDAILPYAEEKAANYSIKSVGSSRWSRIARLTPEQGAELVPLIAEVLGCGMDAAFREQLAGMTVQKGFIVGLYQTKEGGDDLAVYIKGNATFPDGVQRAISYQWAFAENDKNQRVDTYKFDMTKSKAPRDNREISGTLKRSASAGTLLVDGTSKAVIRNPETNEIITTTITHDLSGENGAVTGSYSHAVRTALGEEYSTVTLNATPQLQVEDVDGSSLLTGTVHVEKLQGKTVHTSIDLLFDNEAADAFVEAVENGALYVVVDERLPQSSLTQNLDLSEDEPEDFLVGKPPIGYTAHPVPEEDTEVDLDSLSAEERAALEDEMFQRLAGHLLTAIAKLPPEASALIRDNVSDADFAAFLDLLDE